MSADDSKPQERSKIRWYYRPATVVVAILCVGPLALPLVWLSPAFKKYQKIIITFLLIVLTIWTVKVSIGLYKTLMEEFQDLRNVLAL